MGEVRYMISDASRQVNVEAHVLRYWEEELELEIPRNEMGHRYYTEENILTFHQIRELKDRGYQLKAIKAILPKIKGKSIEELDELPTLPATVETEAPAAIPRTEKMEQFQMLMTEIVARAMRQNTREMGEEIGQIVSENVASTVATEVIENVNDRLLKQMDYLMRMAEEQEEARFKQLDEAIRGHQKINAEAAAAKAEEPKPKKSRGLFKKKKKEKNSDVSVFQEKKEQG